jgi:hypothetical protein
MPPVVGFSAASMPMAARLPVGGGGTVQEDVDLACDCVEALRSAWLGRMRPQPHIRSLE